MACLFRLPFCAISFRFNVKSLSVAQNLPQRDEAQASSRTAISSASSKPILTGIYRRDRKSRGDEAERLSCRTKA